MGIGVMEEKLLCPQALGTPGVLDSNAMRYNGTYSVHAVGLMGTLFNACHLVSSNWFSSYPLVNNYCSPIIADLHAFCMKTENYFKSIHRSSAFEFAE